MLTESSLPTSLLSDSLKEAHGGTQIGQPPRQVLLDCLSKDPETRSGSPREKIVHIVAETSALTLEELEKLWAGGFIVLSLGLDSLSYLEIAFELENTGIDVTNLDKIRDIERFLAQLFAVDNPPLQH